MKGYFVGTALLLGAFSFLFAEETRIRIEGVEDEVVVSLPGNYVPGKTYPAVFYYHGTNGRPTTGLIRSHTGDRDWIVVGMAYAKRGVFELTPAGMGAEEAIFHQVRARLMGECGLDPARLYVSGFSKGGWMSGLLLQKEKSIAGAAILGAGHTHQLEATPAKLRMDTPVFVGVGRQDNNYLFGLKARHFFGGLGAQVEMEAWPRLGHEFPAAGSVGLTEWFALRNDVTPDEKALEDELQEIQGRKQTYERWWGLVEFRERPFVRAVDGLLERVDAARVELEGNHESIAREHRILQLSRQSLAKELEPKTLPVLEEIVRGHATIMESGGDSPQVEVATLDFQRTSAILEAAREQFAAADAKRKEGEVGGGFSNGRRRVPANPLVR